MASPAMSAAGTHCLSVVCPDTTGIVAAVANFFAARRINITEAAYFADPDTGKFFMRTVFDCQQASWDGALADAFAATVALRYGMDWRVHVTARKSRLLILVSKFDHCLNDLLYRSRAGTLPIDVAAVVSNHSDMAELAAWHAIPFHHLPVTPANRAAQEAAIIALIDDLQIDLVVLARYMQVLSPAMVAKLRGRAINIHHSFLPGFKGAKPYQQAHDRGVKLIGATAHYVSEALDEGPIIEQEVERVDHSLTADGLVAIGRDIENVVLARAVRYHVEHRVLLNGHRTVVFR
jgi:formyltetrahydrofolate deformylase